MAKKTLLLIFSFFLCSFCVSALCTTTHPRLTDNYTITFEEKANFSDITNPHYNVFNAHWKLNYYNATNLSLYSYSSNSSEFFTFINSTSEFFPNNYSADNSNLVVSYQRTFSPLDDLDNTASICTICNSLNALEEYPFYSEWKNNSVADCSVSCSKPINKTLLSSIVLVFLLGMLVFLGFGLYYGASGKVIVALVVSFLVMLVCLVVVFQVTQSICLVT